MNQPRHIWMDTYYESLENKHWITVSAIAAAHTCHRLERDPLVSVDIIYVLHIIRRMIKSYGTSGQL